MTNADMKKKLEEMARAAEQARMADPSAAAEAYERSVKSVLGAVLMGVIDRRQEKSEEFTKRFMRGVNNNG